VEDFSAPQSSDLIPLWTKSPSVAIVQYLYASQKSRQYHLPFWIFESLGLRIHTRFVAVSESVADRVREVSPSAQVDIVYAGVTTCSSSPTTTKRTGVLFLGRLEFHMKGLDHLVTAFSEVLKHRPDVRLRVAGDGLDKERFAAALRERGVFDHVDWLGRLEDGKKWDALAAAELLLMPSRFETFGLVALEAMAVGTPVVSFALPSLQEIVGESNCAVLVAPDDAVALGRAATELLGDPERLRELSSASRARAAHFSWDRAAAEQERIYRAASLERHDGRRRTRTRQLLRATTLLASDRRRLRDASATKG